MGDVYSTIGEVYARAKLAADLRGMTLDDAVRRIHKANARRGLAAAVRCAEERPWADLGEHATAFGRLCGVLGVERAWLLAGLGRAPRGAGEAALAAVTAPTPEPPAGPAPGGPFVPPAPPPPAPVRRGDRPTHGALLARMLDALDALDVLCLSEDEFIGRCSPERREGFRYLFNTGRGAPGLTASYTQVERAAAALGCDVRWLASGEGVHGIVRRDVPPPAPTPPAAPVVEARPEVAPAPSPAPASPSSELAPRAFVFEGQTLRLRFWRGRPCVTAQEFGALLQYEEPRKLVANIRGPWAEEFTEGTDYLVLTGDDLAAWKRLCTDPVQSDPDRSPALVLLLESGMYLAAIKAKTPVGVRARRWLAEEVLPAIRRDGAYLAPGREPQGLDRGALKALVVDLAGEVVRTALPVVLDAALAPIRAELAENRGALRVLAPRGPQLQIEPRPRTPRDAVTTLKLRPRIERLCIELSTPTTRVTMRDLSTRMGRDDHYLEDLLNRANHNPRRTTKRRTVEAIARAAACDPAWLRTGRGVPFPVATRPADAAPAPKAN